MGQKTVYICDVAGCGREVRSLHDGVIVTGNFLDPATDQPCDLTFPQHDGERAVLCWGCVRARVGPPGLGAPYRT